MPTPPDQFQRRTYVRLPFTDEYLGAGEERMSETLVRALARPWLTVQISESVVKSASCSRTGSWSHVPSAAAERKEAPQQQRTISPQEAGRPRSSHG